jgi:CarboxypepD_reg-like domain
MKNIVLSLLILFSTNLFAQTFNGKVTNLKTNEVLPYANAGVRGTTIGGIADDGGNFKIDISKASANDKIVVSYLGFEPITYLVSELKTNQVYEVKLNPKSVELKEVAVYNKRVQIILGNNKKSFYHTGWGHNTSDIGRARGAKINPADLPVKAEEFVIHIHENTFDNVKFRLNIMIPGENGENSTSLINENIFFTTSVKKGWVRVDLKPYNIVISEKLIVAVEWVDASGRERTEKEDSHQLTISMSKKAGYFYTRETPEESTKLEMSDRTPSMYFVCYGIGK